MAAFETDDDRNNELSVAEIAGKYLGLKLKKTPSFFIADYVAEDESVYLEVRCRNNSRDKHPKFLISLRKWNGLLKLKTEKSNPSIYLAVAWADCIGLLEIDFGKIELVSFKRNKSEGTHTKDIMLAIPVSKFQIISDKVRLTKSRNWISSSSWGE